MTEDTQEREALIQEMLRDAEKTEPPSELKENPVIHRGDETQPAPMTVREMTSAGYVWIWDTRTFERSRCLSYMVPQKMRQRRKDGSYVYTTNDPKRLPKRGKLKCLLHPDSPNRKQYDDMGFRVCMKDGIMNRHQQEMHMLKKHPQEWAAIKEERERIEREEDRELRRALIKQQMNPSRFDSPKRGRPKKSENKKKPNSDT